MKILGLLLVISAAFAHDKNVSIETLKQLQAKINTVGYAYRTGPIRIYDESLTEVPQLNIVSFGAPLDDKSSCIVTYSSLNPPYNQLPILLFNTLKSRFNGHLLYRKGGWPNMHKGCLKHAFAGYGFKVCAIQEAFDLGYKKVLWLDSIMEATRHLSPLFKFLDNHPCLYRYSGFSFKSYVNQALINEFHLKQKQILKHPHIASGVLGFNFDFPICKSALRVWHEKTDKNLKWPKHFPEQLLLSIILTKHGLHKYAFGSKLLHIHSRDPAGCFLRLRPHRKVKIMARKT